MNRASTRASTDQFLRPFIVQLTLLIPDLLPAQGAEHLARGQAPLLRRLLARGNTRFFPAIAAEHWLCQAFEIEQRQDWPVAPLTALLDGLPAESGHWLRADPIHLQLHRDRMAVLAPPALELTQDEASALCQTLNAHFAGEGLRIEAARPQRWYIAGADAPGLPLPPPSKVAGRALPREALPAPWHRRLTEIQMLLHEHPVNQAREARGAPPVNSLLLWGHGQRLGVPGRHYSHVWSNDALAVALAVQSGAECADTPASAPAWLAAGHTAPDSHHLVQLDDAHLGARYGGPDKWIQALERLERNWFAPLWSLLGGRLKAIDLVAPGDDCCLRFDITAAHKLRFWRRNTWPAGA